MKLNISLFFLIFLLLSCIEENNVKELDGSFVKYTNSISQDNNKADTLLAVMIGDLDDKGYTVNEVLFYTVISTPDSNKFFYAIIETNKLVGSGTMEHQIMIKYYNYDTDPYPQPDGLSTLIDNKKKYECKSDCPTCSWNTDPISKNFVCEGCAGMSNKCEVYESTVSFNPNFLVEGETVMQNITVANFTVTNGLVEVEVD